MYQYSPLTGEFIARHVAELRRLEAFVEVRELAGEEAATGFLIGLWEGRSEFDVAGDRLIGRDRRRPCERLLDRPATPPPPSGEVIVPLIGFHMPADEIVLDGVRIVRADTVADAPSGRGRGDPPSGEEQDRLPGDRSAARTPTWRRPPPSPTTCAARCGPCGSSGPAPSAWRTHGWARRAGGWERFGTAAGRPRHGGYRLTGNEVAELEAFSKTLTQRGARMPSLALGHLALRPRGRAALADRGPERLPAGARGLLEGGGSANLGLSARVAVLAGDRTSASRPASRRARADDRAQADERRALPARRRPSPLEVIAEVEELLRRMLKGLATGELEGDLRTAADELLLADGLRAAEVAQPDRGDRRMAPARTPVATSSI